MTTMVYNSPEDLKRKLDADESLQGPMQKLLRRSPSNELFSQGQLSFDEDDGDDYFDEDMQFNEESTNLQDQSPEQQQKEQQQQQQPATPQRKKPGRKPNPASPALRKAQNRAAQRAFRERKERHLRELENTIKTLRESQYEALLKSQRDYSHFRSLIEQLEAENSFLKEVAFTFECALNSINGNNEATTTMKNRIRSNSLPLSNSNGNNMNSPFGGIGTVQMRQASLPSHQTIPTAQQLQNTFYNLLQSQQANVNSSVVNNNIMMSPSNISTTSSSSPQTPESAAIPDSGTFFAEEFAREISLADMKPFVSQTSLFPDTNTSSMFKTNNSICSSQLMSKTNSNASTTISTISNDSINSINSINTNDSNLSSSFMAEAASMIDNDADLFSAYILNDEWNSTLENVSNFDLSTSSDQDITKKRIEQIIRLSKKIGQLTPGPVNPRTRYPLTSQQMYYLTLSHDPRIDMIPCLHLRSRMIQYQDQYDLTELMELLITKAKCHGDALDPDSWELPEEFFESYNVLVFQHCRIKSSLYKKYGRLPKDFENFYKKGLHLIS